MEACYYCYCLATKSSVGSREPRVCYHGSDRSSIECKELVGSVWSLYWERSASSFAINIVGSRVIVLLEHKAANWFSIACVCFMSGS